MIPFGNTTCGQQVHAITLSGHGLSATILTYGAILQDVRLDGIDHSLTIGSDNLADYENAMQYFGCVVAPVANRLSNAAANIGGKTYNFETNLDQQHTLHSGSTGAHKAVWHVDDVTPTRAMLSCTLEDGLGGFPGNRTITALFEIDDGPTLHLTLVTETDAHSIANATNHSYWNLDGSDTFSGHQIRIAADHYLPIDDAHSLATGEIRAVENTPFDLRATTRLTPVAPPLDHTFCVAKDRRALTDCLWLTGASGVSMTVATTEPGVHIYDARDANHRGLAIEAQGWPDAPNKPNFPNINITSNALLIQTTQWRFSR